MTTLIQMFFAVGLCYYGVFWLNSTVMQFPLDLARDILLKVYHSKVRSSLFGVLISAFFTDNMAIFVFLGSLMNVGSLAFRYAYLILVWSCVGAISLMYITPLSIDTFVYFFLGIVCFQVTSRRWGEFRNVIVGLFGLAFILFGVMILSQSTLELREAPWFQEFIQLSQRTIFFPLLLGFLLQIGLRSAFLVILVGATILELKVYGLDALLVYFTGAALGSTVHWLILHHSVIRDFKQLTALLVIFYATCAAVFALPVITQKMFGYSSVLNLFEHFEFSSKILSANIMGIGLIIAALIVSFMKSYYEKKILEFWPASDAEENPGTPIYLEKQAFNTPEIAIGMIQYEQVRLLAPLGSYFDILRSAHTQPLKEMERVYVDVESLEFAIQNFLTELSNTRLNSVVIEKFLNFSIRQKVLKSLNLEVYEFAKTMVSTTDSAQMSTLKSNLMEALDVTVMNLKDLMETEESTPHEDDPMLRVLLVDRTEVIENQRKAYLSKQSELGINEKKQILESTLHFERSLWLVEELIRLAFESHARHEKDIEIKKRWLNELSMPT